jgi:hypothetical protein
MGKPLHTDFRLEEAPVAEPGDGEMLLAVRYLSLDPYMRGRMDDRKSYSPPTPVGGVMLLELHAGPDRHVRDTQLRGRRATSSRRWAEMLLWHTNLKASGMPVAALTAVAMSFSAFAWVRLLR